MVSSTTSSRRATNVISASRRSEILDSLIPVAAGEANAQLDAFTIRLTDALLALSEQSNDSKVANLTFNAANLLKKNAYAFYYTATANIEDALLKAIQNIEKAAVISAEKNIGGLSLVSYEEMDNKLTVGNLCRPIEALHAELFGALGIRLGVLFDRDEFTPQQNPFRPETFLHAIQTAWCEFNPDTEAHGLILPLMTPDIFLDLTPVLQAMNDALIGRGIQTEIDDSYRIKKTNAKQDATKKEAVAEQLKRFFNPDADAEEGHFGGMGAGNGAVNGFGSGSGGPAGNAPAQYLQGPVASSQLLGFLGGMQKNIFDQNMIGGALGNTLGTSLSNAFNNSLTTAALSSIKSQAPQGTLRKVDEHTIDLLTKIFEVVFRDQNIPTEIKSLIGNLQVPVLKASLIDQDFFYKEEHPARRLIELLSKYSLGWDQKKGLDDPLYQTMKRNVTRVQQEYDQQVSVFSDVVTDLESYINQEESASTAALSTPITHAIQKEKIIIATKAAKTDVAMRIGTGEVVAFVETFLESKWIPVLTIAYSVKHEKPQALDSAIKTMDDLIWSVKPKITNEQRKELVAKLPALLATLNKWLDIVKLDDTARLQFFAELAECHASIVRAPIEMSPERRLEISMDVAKKAAERRLEIRAQQQPEVAADEFVEAVERLERGTWLEFIPKNQEVRKYKLAWISPMRSLFIFTTGDKKESISLSAEKLAEAYREHVVQTVMLDGLVNRALEQAMESVGANDPEIEAKTAA